MFVRFHSNTPCSRHSSHTFRFTHIASGTFPEHKFYCAVCEEDGQKYCFVEAEIASFELVRDGSPSSEAHVQWLLGITAELQQTVAEVQELEAA